MMLEIEKEMGGLLAAEQADERTGQPGVIMER
jgi:hypothetical protein